MKSLKTKIILMMVVLISVPLLTLGITSLSLFRSEIEVSVDAKLNDLVNQTADILQAEVDKATLIAEAATQDINTIAYLQGDSQKKEEVYKGLVSRYDARADMIESLVVVDTNSWASVSSLSIDMDIDLTDRAYLQTALGGETGISPAIISKATGDPVIAIAQPVYSDGEIIGAVIATVKFTNITDIVRDIQVFESGYSYLFDRDGLVLSHINPDNDFTLNLTELDISELDTMLVEFNRTGYGESWYTYNDVYKYVRYTSVGEMGLAVTADYNDYMSAYISVRNTAIILLVISALLAVLFAWLFTGKVIINPLNVIKDRMVRAGAGDLTVKAALDQKDEIGAISKSFDKMMDQLNELMNQINVASEQVASGSVQVSQSSMSLSQGATEQASSIEELMASVQQITSQIETNNGDTDRAKSMTEKTQALATSGNDQMRDMLKAMEEINESSNNISSIIKAIDDIAFQTNILALNAAVEAARAGQYGKGFAVVAEEVRNLAAKSAGAAQEITTMIENSVNKVNDGMAISEKTAKALTEMVDDVTEIASIVNNISRSSHEQYEGVSQINIGISQISDVVQNTSANSEETAAASEELSSQAELLKHQISQFKVRNSDASPIQGRIMQEKLLNENRLRLSLAESDKY